MPWSVPLGTRRSPQLTTRSATSPFFQTGHFSSGLPVGLSVNVIGSYQPLGTGTPLLVSGLLWVTLYVHFLGFGADRERAEGAGTEKRYLLLQLGYNKRVLPLAGLDSPLLTLLVPASSPWDSGTNSKNMAQRWHVCHNHQRTSRYTRFSRLGSCHGPAQP